MCIRDRKYTNRALVALGVFTFGTGVPVADAWRDIGARAQGERLERMRQSSAWTGEAFDNALPRHDGPYGDGQSYARAPRPGT